MGAPEAEPATARTARISFAVIAGLLIASAWLNLGMPLLAALFAYLALDCLHVFKSRGKWLAVLLFLVLVSALGYALGFSINQAVKTLPEIADKAIPSVIEFARERQIELPFTDYDSLKEMAFDAVKNQVYFLSSFANFARGATKQFVFLLAGIVVAMSLFLDPRRQPKQDPGAIPGNLYASCYYQILSRFGTFYQSFTTVMGAQIIISAINTLLTALFVFTIGMPYPVVILGLTFLFGLLPVIGNLISNTVIVGIGFTVSPRLALEALIFLVVIHKLEYFLNSKIVGDRIRNPIWLTLIALILGEKLMGVPGMILAPVVLNYIRLETSRIPAHPSPAADSQPPATGSPPM